MNLKLVSASVTQMNTSISHMDRYLFFMYSSLINIISIFIIPTVYILTTVHYVNLLSVSKSRDYSLYSLSVLCELNFTKLAM